MYKEFWDNVGTISTRTFKECRSQRGESTDRELHANEERSISWEYRTTRNKYVSPNYFDWNLFGGNWVKAHGACVRNYDSRQLVRHDAYNREYLVTLARRRVLRFSETEPRINPDIRSEDRPTKVKTVLLAGTYLDKTAAFYGVARHGTRTEKR
ncbi:hypothetical protein NW755_003853 [Fusarium falciforme]|uniref:Uncharacterized protein n=1 Tax=Fusarium falciforme TaxID=195108 RepID=A0A9W8RAJ2_9HYPO|nr:hypothetical protein NW755_003853 [Fusarium falciforme]KAJ4250480.1 hypothetical protein NW757_007312 [Fusarium falciforme]